MSMEEQMSHIQVETKEREGARECETARRKKSTGETERKEKVVAVRTGSRYRETFYSTTVVDLIICSAYF